MSVIIFAILLWFEFSKNVFEKVNLNIACDSHTICHQYQVIWENFHQIIESDKPLDSKALNRVFRRREKVFDKIIFPKSAKCNYESN